MIPADNEGYQVVDLRAAAPPPGRGVWSLSVIWLGHREPERPQVVVVYVDARTGTVMGAAPRAAVTRKAVRALPAADGIPGT